MDSGSLNNTFFTQLRFVRNSRSVVAEIQETVAKSSILTEHNLQCNPKLESHYSKPTDFNELWKV